MYFKFASDFFYPHLWKCVRKLKTVCGSVGPLSRCKSDDSLSCHLFWLGNDAVCRRPVPATAGMLRSFDFFSIFQSEFGCLFINKVEIEASYALEWGVGIGKLLRFPTTTFRKTVLLKKLNLFNEWLHKWALCCAMTLILKLRLEVTEL